MVKKSLISVPGEIISSILIKFLILDDCISLAGVQQKAYKNFIVMILDGSCILDCGRDTDETDLEWMHSHNLSSETISLKIFMKSITVSKLTRMWSTLRHLSICSINETKTSDVQYNNSIQKSNYPVVYTPRSLENIYIYGSKPLSDDLMWQLLSGCHNLTDIHIASYRMIIEPSTITHILIENPNLQSFKIHDIHNFKNDNFIQLFQYCKQLRSFNISDYPYFNNDQYLNVLSTLNSLQILKFNGYHRPLDSILQLIFNNLLQLQSIDISNCQIHDCNHLVSVTKYCTQIHTLKLRNRDNISEQNFIAIVHNCPQLNVLDISFHKYVTDTVLITIGQHCKQLHTIDISHCHTVTDIGFIALSQLKDSLQSINIIECNNITFPAVVIFSKNCHRIKRFLSSITESGSSLDKHDNNNIWNEIFASWKELRILNLCESTNKSHTAGWTKLSFIDITLYKLQLLHLSKIPLLTDEALLPLFYLILILNQIFFQ